MPIQYSWLLEGRIILMQSSGTITKEDIEKENKIMAAFFAETDAPLIHVIADQRKLDTLPSPKNFAASEWVKNPHLGWFVFFGMDSRFLRIIFAVGTQLFGFRNRLFDTYEECLSFLQGVDDTLPDLQNLPLKETPPQ